MLDRLEQQPPDALLALIKLHDADPRHDKIDLGVGVYRTGQGEPPVFGATKAAEAKLVAEQDSKAYLVGGFNASYLRKGDVVLIPIRVGAGLRLGVNAGYMKFSEEQRWLPF